MKEYYEKKAVSNSGMAYINPEQGGSPVRYKNFIIDGNKLEQETPSLENGKLVHLYVEDPDFFTISDASKPTGKLGDWVDEVFNKSNPSWDKDCVKEDNLTLKKLAISIIPKYGNTTDEDKLWAKFQEGFPYLKHLYTSTQDLCITSKQRETVEACIASLRNKKVANELLFQTGEDFGDEAHNELPIYWKETVTINDDQVVELDCKALLDRIKIFKEDKRVHVVDLKTTSKPVSKFESSFEYYRYYRQMAWYLKAAAIYIEQRFGSAEGWNFNVVIVAVETTMFHETKVFNISPGWIKKGTIEYQGLLSRIAVGTLYDNWLESIEEMESNGIINLIHEDDAGAEI